PPAAPSSPLCGELKPPAIPALGAPGRVAVSGPGGIDPGALAALLFFSAGLTRKKTYPGGEAIHFRAAPSTGALYEVEAYVVAGAVADLAAGVYHFAPGEFALRPLPTGDRPPAL